MPTIGEIANMQVGQWDIRSGVSGTLDLSTISASGNPVMVQTVTAIAGASDATIKVDNRSVVTIPAGQSITLSPKGTVWNPTIIFTNTSAYVVEFVTHVKLRGYTEGDI